jgi:cell division protease FtsH
MILYGPPGTGKTLLGRAIAGEAGVPFFRVTGSNLFNKWLGGTAERIRNLYAKARSYSGGAIIFIDEGDAIGGSREARSQSGADSERNAALNQLLSELDGFDQSDVFTIVATNRIDILDEAFTRAGRFDIQLFVGPPDIDGRVAILKEHTAAKPLAEDVDLRQIARETTGATGATLEGLANEAALTAGRVGAETITTEHFTEALATIEQGPQRKGATVNEDERMITAYHEAGHALAALLEEDMDNPVRVTIVPRGQSGGHTRIAPAEDRQYISKQRAKATLAWMMSGRAAEKIYCGADNFTSGASDDLQHATRLAEQMVCLWGMGTYNTSIPLKTWRQSPHAEQVEQQVEELLDQAEVAAISLLLKHLPALTEMVEQLLAQETIQGSALQRYGQATALDGAELDQVEAKYEPVRNSVRMAHGSAGSSNGQVPVLTTR